MNRPAPILPDPQRQPRDPDRLYVACCLALAALLVVMALWLGGVL